MTELYIGADQIIQRHRDPLESYYGRRKATNDLHVKLVKRTAALVATSAAAKQLQLQNPVKRTQIKMFLSKRRNCS